MGYLVIAKLPSLKLLQGTVMNQFTDTNVRHDASVS